MSINDSIDAASQDPELNRVADTRTAADLIASLGATGGPDISQAFEFAVEFAEYARQVVEVCDAYIKLRAQCPRGAVIVRPFEDIDGNPAQYFDDAGESTTLFEKVRSALEFSNIHALINEVA